MNTHTKKMVSDLVSDAEDLEEELNPLDVADKGLLGPEHEADQNLISWSCWGGGNEEHLILT
jgi:hypothetical protein